MSAGDGASGGRPWSMDDFEAVAIERLADTLYTNASTKLRREGQHDAPEEEILLKNEKNESKALPRVPTISVAEIPSSDNGNNFRRSSTGSTSAPQFGIFWRSPITMLSTFFVGLASALSLHGYYASLNGKQVGDSAQQQKALRVGTTLAFITQVCLVSSVYLAYVQCLWKALKRSIISVQAVDAGFDAYNTLKSFTNVEMIWKLRIASFLALIAWCIPISSLFTPATLNVDTIIKSSARMMNVSTLQINQAAEYTAFAYSVPRQDITNKGLVKYLGPRTVMKRLAVATATTGQVLSLPQPYTNATYQQLFSGPFVQCQDAADDIAEQVDAVANRSTLGLSDSMQAVSVEYFAFVPALDSMNSTTNTSNVQAANLSTIDGASSASNQLWLRFPRFNDSDFAPDVTTQTTNLHYLTCQLHNASYHVEFVWENGIQSLNILDHNVTDAIQYPTNVTSSSYDEEEMAYSAFMWALSNQLTGSMAFYRDVSANDSMHEDIAANRTYSEINTDMDQTSLLGSSDLNSYFIKNHILGGGAASDHAKFSAQRLQDMALARNRTLDVLIQELSSNITLSLISNPLLSPSTMTNVTTKYPTTLYSYHPLYVLIAYLIAFFFALIANILGLFAYFANGVSHDNTFSSIVCTTRDIHLSRLNAHERLGALPLDPRVGRTKLRFDVGEMEGEGEAGRKKGSGRWGFGIADLF